MDGRWVGLVLAFSTFACSDIPSNHDTEATCGCVAEPIRMSPLGSPIETTTTIAPCRTFRLDVAPIGSREAASCTTSMVCPALPTGFTTITVAQAVLHPDVQAALREGSMRYGAGPAGADGGGSAIYRVGVGAADFEVGGDCGSSSPCTPVPDGVRTLLNLLLAVNQQEFRRSPCRETFTF